MDIVVSFKANGEVVEKLKNDAKMQYSSISAILRQIVYRHYGIERSQTAKIMSHKSTSRDCEAIKQTSQTTQNIDEQQA